MSLGLHEGCLCNTIRFRSEAVSSPSMTQRLDIDVKNFGHATRNTAPNFVVPFARGNKGTIERWTAQWRGSVSTSASAPLNRAVRDRLRVSVTHYQCERATFLDHRPASAAVAVEFRISREPRLAPEPKISEGGSRIPAARRAPSGLAPCIFAGEDHRFTGEDHRPGPPRRQNVAA